MGRRGRSPRRHSGVKLVGRKRETTMTFEEIKRQALELPRDEKLDLLEAILQSLEDAGYEIDWERLEVVGRPRETPSHQNETP
jgi:hypothetical protein